MAKYSELLVMEAVTLEPAGGTAPSELPLDEMIDIAVYAEHPSGARVRLPDFCRSILLRFGSVGPKSNAGHSPAARDQHSTRLEQTT